MPDSAKADGSNISSWTLELSRRSGLIHQPGILVLTLHSTLRDVYTVYHSAKSWGLKPSAHKSAEWSNVRAFPQMLRTRPRPYRVARSVGIPSRSLNGKKGSEDRTSPLMVFRLSRRQTHGLIPSIMLTRAVRLTICKRTDLSSTTALAHQQQETVWPASDLPTYSLRLLKEVQYEACMPHSPQPLPAQYEQSSSTRDTDKPLPSHPLRQESCPPRVAKVARIYNRGGIM
jgi:hypothetical protein